MKFGPAPARFLTLTGSNTGNNTLAPLIGNEPAAGLAATAEEIENGFGSVGIRKTGIGKWILSNNNTYSGATNVEAGTLIVNGNQTGSGTTTVSAGATLGGGGSLPGALINRGIVAPGTMTVKGNYVQAAGATLAIEIGGTGAGAFDLLNVLEGVDTGPVEGDYNGDFVVNAADYTVWRDHLGQTLQDDSFQLMNEDEHTSPGIVDQADYTFWRQHFGNANLSYGIATLSGTINIDLIGGFTPANGNSFTILTAPEGLSAYNLSLSGESSGFNLIVNPTSLVLQYIGAGVGSLGSGAVPEPASLVLVGIALAACGCVRRRVV
jgi:autotransporter-associated beta strand protein